MDECAQGTALARGYGVNENGANGNGAIAGSQEN